MALQKRCCCLPLYTCVLVFAILGYFIDFVYLCYSSAMLTAAKSTTKELSSVIVTVIYMSIYLVGLDVLLKKVIIISFPCKNFYLLACYVFIEIPILFIKAIGYFWFVSSGIAAGFPPVCTPFAVAWLLHWLFEAYYTDVVASCYELEQLRNDFSIVSV